MDRVIIIRYGEIVLKGLNRRFFEDKLLGQVRKALNNLGKLKVYKKHSRIYVDVGNYNEDDIIERVKKIFGIVSISPANKIPVDMDIIKDTALRELEDVKNRKSVRTFKIETRRADKTFPIKSPDVSRKVGAHVLHNTPGVSVDVHSPDVTINIEIRNYAYVYNRVVDGHGGLPLGTNGKAMLLLSGGIDSPVAGWLVGKRGVAIEAIHYHSYPFTSERAQEKVLDLARQLAIYFGDFKLNLVNLLPIQKEINEKCPGKEMTILSRRFMMKIAEKVAEQSGCQALVTGESIGQVASQTIEGLQVTNAAVELPVFRPLITMDKVEIIDLARTIGTYETSILPFEDCCTVFLPKHPVIKPKLNRILQSESLLDGSNLINKLLKEMEERIISVRD